MIKKRLIVQQTELFFWDDCYQNKRIGNSKYYELNVFLHSSRNWFHDSCSPLTWYNCNGGMINASLNSMHTHQLQSLKVNWLDWYGFLYPQTVLLLMMNPEIGLVTNCGMQFGSQDIYQWAHSFCSYKCDKKYTK